MICRPQLNISAAIPITHDSAQARLGKLIIETPIADKYLGFHPTEARIISEMHTGGYVMVGDPPRSFDAYATNLLKKIVVLTPLDNYPLQKSSELSTQIVNHFHPH